MSNGLIKYKLPTCSRRWFHFLEIVLFSIRLNNDRLGNKAIQYINKTFNPIFCGDLKNVKDINIYLKSPNLNIMSALYLYPTHNKNEDEPYLISKGYSYTAEMTKDFLFYETGLKLSDKQFKKLFSKRNLFKMIAFYLRLLFDSVFDNEYNKKFEWKYDDIAKFKDLMAACQFSNHLGAEQHNYAIQTIDKLQKCAVYDLHYFCGFDMPITGEDVFYLTELFLLSESEFVKKYGNEILLKYQETKIPIDPISEIVIDGYVENIKTFRNIIENNYTEIECYLTKYIKDSWQIYNELPRLFKYVSIHQDKATYDLFSSDVKLNQAFFTKVYNAYKCMISAKNKVAEYQLAILDRKII